MSAAHLHLGRDWEWRRVGAWSGSFAAHLIAVALLTAPWAVSRINPVEKPEPTVVVLRDPPPPALPVPPPPVPPPPQAHPRKPTVPVRVVEATPMPTPIPPTVTTDPTAPAQPSQPRGDSLVQTPSTAAPGIAQKLAYDGVLRPPYPMASVRAREQGTVVLRVLVGSDGSVQQVDVERSSGHAKLDAAAREAVLRGRFRPVMQDGKAIPAWGLVPIEFRLDRV